MRVEATAASVSWIPSESVGGALRRGFDVGLAHYDPPPPDALDDEEHLHRLCRDDRFRFANLLRGWADVEGGRVVAGGFGPGSGLVMGSTTVRVAGVGATFRAMSLPAITAEPVVEADSVRLSQTVGGRTGVPLPRPVPHPPFVQWNAPIVWTTLTLTLRADGSSHVQLSGASAFPRHWVFGTDLRLQAKSGLTDQSTWVAHSFGERTPWSAQDSPALVTAAESELERQLSEQIMRGGRRPEVRRLAAGDVLTRQREIGDEVYLLLDGVLRVDVDGEELADVGPGAVLGERALLQGGRRTSTLTAVTAARVAVAAREAVDLDRLRELAPSHHREHPPPLP
ncbi:cyclic nucleotide-binding domain-containing protein [Angustibacter sp. Root456]|uniref:cyclic nucleotide-binding domain-containing protein n=1 Tax=Angustibacter sp. Root456 TaxID=1736539 RepID=UPI000A6E25D8|nr:cyclic nucleotide-binding domain-containing protein [Angustibacter sp. Root456]